DEGFDAAGRSFLYHHLIGRGSKVKIQAEDLERYDENIYSHLAEMNRGRAEPITLRYFQYLAVLYTEIFLDRYFNHRAQLLADLNSFVRERNAAKLPGEPFGEEFVESDLTKLACWMATGSGKTLILHLNYYQFLHYTPELPDNILLITPNEGLSEQHLGELAASGIPARRFELNSGGLYMGGKNTVQVIEITKLVEEKRGGGVSVPVEVFEGNNLIFVDEGHKGSGGEAWRGYREALGETGFTFEYSATFGQALSAARNDPLTAEYGKAIYFDYSYRYFYSDGFGKDFRILNLQEDSRVAQTEMLLLGNLLSFYEQLRIFQERASELRPYNLEKPLWVFVGSRVNAVYSENREKRSDVLTVARFLHHVLENKGDWVGQGIQKLLEGKSGLATPDGTDIFTGRFTALRETGLSAQELYADILVRIFHAPASSGLHLCGIRSSAGELGLKAGGADDYFGLIYIGDTNEFKKLVESDRAGIVLEEDVISDSLFDDINRRDSKINILIGAKKFMEGWNSWRVSNMGLLNIGRREGSQIIQLFGRGVRLRGKDRLLKRSSALEGTHPPRLRLLETLNIFAVRANYMAQFRDYLEREGIEVDAPVELQLSILTNDQFLKRGLIVPRLEEGREFRQETSLLLEADPVIRFAVDLSVKAQTIESSDTGLQITEVRGGTGRNIPAENLALVNWEQAYLDLLAYKERKGLQNLIVRPGVLPKIIKEGNYTLVADEAVTRPCSFAERSLLQEAIVRLLCKYVDSFYRYRREKWEEQNLVYKTLDKNDLNLAFNRELVRDGSEGMYILKVRKSEANLIEAIYKLYEDLDRLFKQETDELPRLYFDRHLYLPLLLEKSDKLSAAPQGLVDSEAKFVRDLKEYWEKEKDKSLKGKEVFLLRNLSRGKGVGFFEESGFYPDFILWVVDSRSQRIVFIEPHGMLHASAYIHDEKARLHERLPKLAKEIEKRSKKKGVSLDSFIISATPYDDMRKRYDDGTWDLEKFAEKHILFLQRDREYDYIQTILTG
ncbi:MAG TPA: DEAD/DEAH box helicase family protein, partial [Firmicutes bacterium]|nr:DEAD/DEAH box helicase family protein [Bacillota bacterium]